MLSVMYTINNFYDLAKIHQITELNTLSKFPAIQYGTNTENTTLTHLIMALRHSSS